MSTSSKHKAARLRNVLLLVLLVFSHVNISDELQTLTATEIQELLSGNTAVGDWGRHSYRQYFAADGITIYAQEGSRSSRGKWRVNTGKDLYESWWENTDWSGYGVARDGDKLFWLTPSGSLPPQSFEILPGNQLTKK